MKSHRMRLNPKYSMAVLTEKAICVQGTDRVGTTSQGYLELSAAGKGGKAFPGTMRDGTCSLESPVIVYHTDTARTTHCRLDLTQLHWYLGAEDSGVTVPHMG